MTREQVLEKLSYYRIDGWHAQLFDTYIPDEEYETFYVYRRTNVKEDQFVYDRRDDLYLATRDRLYIIVAETNGFEEVSPGPKAKELMLLEFCVPLRCVRHVGMVSTSTAFHQVPARVEVHGYVDLGQDLPSFGSAIRLPDESLRDYKHAVSPAADERAISEPERGPEITGFLHKLSGQLA